MLEPLKIYGGYMAAQRRKHIFNYITAVQPTTFVSESDRLAEAYAMGDCKSVFPAKEGWFNHRVGVIQVADYVLDMLVGEIIMELVNKESIIELKEGSP